MIEFAIRSGHINSAGSSRRHLKKWSDGSAVRRLRPVFFPALAAAFLSACSMSDEHDDLIKQEDFGECDDVINQSGG